MVEMIHSATPSATDVSALLGDYTDLVNRHGIESPQCQSFLAQHGHNADFLSLARGVEILRRKINLLRAEAADAPACAG